MIGRTWNTHAVALGAAHALSLDTGQRAKVKVEHGVDKHGPYRFRVDLVPTPAVAPAEVAEPCS